MLRFRDITQADVGRSVFRAFGTVWQTSSFIGRITSLDVGKRVYLSDDGNVLQVENDKQRAERLAREKAASQPSMRPTQVSSADVHFAKARAHSAEAQRKVEAIQGRGPSPENELGRVLASIRESATKLTGRPIAELPAALRDIELQIKWALDSLEAQNALEAQAVIKGMRSR